MAQISIFRVTSYVERTSTVPNLGSGSHGRETNGKETILEVHDPLNGRCLMKQNFECHKPLLFLYAFLATNEGFINMVGFLGSKFNSRIRSAIIESTLIGFVSRFYTLSSERDIDFPHDHISMIHMLIHCNLNYELILGGPNRVFRLMYPNRRMLLILILRSKSSGT